MKTKRILSTVTLLFAAASLSCDEKEIDSLKGTTWKLEGIVNEQTGAMQVLEPIDCEQCYTLEFETNTTAKGKSTTNEQLFDFNQTPILLGSTKIGEIGNDGHLYYDLIFNITSHQFENDVLYFYCMLEGINYILKFNKLPQ
jgi:hypothetical protein